MTTRATTTPTADGGPEGRLPLGGPRDRPSVPAAPDLRGAYRFVSAPDFLNQDVADLTAGGRQEYVDPRTGDVANSTNEEYDAGLDARDGRDGVARHPRRARRR